VHAAHPRRTATGGVHLWRAMIRALVAPRTDCRVITLRRGFRSHLIPLAAAPSRTTALPHYLRTVVIAADRPRGRSASGSRIFTGFSIRPAVPRMRKRSPARGSASPSPDAGPVRVVRRCGCSTDLVEGSRRNGDLPPSGAQSDLRIVVAAAPPAPFRIVLA
jgi:hypothetical protein